MDAIKEQFNHYRKWFGTLRKEFLNLPNEYQEKFMTILDRFKADCEKCHKEHKEKIKEKTLRVLIQKIERPDNKKENFIIYGKIAGQNDELQIVYNASSKVPEIGSIITYTIYSVDEIIWYSSKEELITRGV